MTPDEIDEKLARLPRAEVDDLTGERVRRRAQAELGRARSLGRLAPAADVWSRVVTPLLLASACGIYLIWAVRAAEALYQ